MRWTWQDRQQVVQLKQEEREKPEGVLTGSVLSQMPKRGGRIRESGSYLMVMVALIVQMSKVDSSLLRCRSSGGMSYLISTKRARFRNMVLFQLSSVVCE